MRGICAAAVWVLLLAAARADEPRALTSADKKEMDRILREFVEGNEEVRAKLLEAATAFDKIAAKDFAPYADKLAKLKRKLLPGKGGAERLTLTLPDGQSWSYQIRCPGGYVPGKPVPLLIFLHGTKGYDRAEDWLNAGPGAGYLTLTPLAPSGWWDRAETDKLFFETLRLLRRNYSIDGNRVFLAGFNYGGCGTWYYGLRFPQLFAGLGPMAANFYPGNDNFDAALHVPVWIWHGEKDEDIAPDDARRAAKTLGDLGYKVQYKEVPGGLTCDWYMKDLNAIQKEFFAGIAKLKRTANPDKVIWSRKPPGKAYPTAVAWPDGCYWIEVPESEKTASVTAEKTAKGKFKLTTKGAKRVTVLLNSALVDAGAPVEVELDGKAAFSGVPLCSLKTLLRTWGRYEDPELTYTAEVTVGK